MENFDYLRGKPIQEPPKCCKEHCTDHHTGNYLLSMDVHFRIEVDLCLEHARDLNTAGYVLSFIKHNF